MVGRTSLTDPSTGEQYPFMGLFSGIDLPAGAFLGFYNGKIKDGEYRGRDSYTLNVGSVHIKPPKKKGGVDPVKYPLAMINEPPTGTDANAFIVDFSKAKDVIPSLPKGQDIAAIGFYTCRAIKGGEELFVNYGTDYYRGKYPNPHNLEDLSKLVGGGCKLKKGERETPMQMMALFGLFYVDKECYVELE